MRLNRAPLIAALALSLMSASCFDDGGEPYRGGKALLVYTNDVIGELEPCGCRSNPLGGMVRKANLLDRTPEKGTLSIDAGNLLFAQNPVPEVLKAQSVAQAEHLISIYNILGHDLVVPGPKDLGAGLDTFEKLRRKADFEFIAANLKRRDGKPFLKPRMIFRRDRPGGGKMRIGVFGIVGEPFNWADGVAVEPPLPAAEAQVRALMKEKVDLIIAATHQGFEADKILAEKVKGIDIIVGANSQSFLQDPPDEHGVRVFQTSFRNQYVGIVPLVPRENGKTFPVKGHRLVAMDAGYDLDEKSQERARMVAAEVKAYKAAVAAINSGAGEQEASSAAEAAKSAYQTFPRCAECHLPQFDFWRKTKHADALHSLLKGNQLANKDCLGCHTLAMGAEGGWSEVPKIALVKLTRKGKEEGDFEEVTENPKIEELERYLHALHTSASLTSQLSLPTSKKEKRRLSDSVSTFTHSWAPVQCENCHGTGGEHPFAGSITRKPDTSLCLKCHTQHRAPKWWTGDGKPDKAVIAAKLKSVSCPAGGSN